MPNKASDDNSKQSCQLPRLHTTHRVRRWCIAFFETTSLFETQRRPKHSVFFFTKKGHLHIYFNILLISIPLNAWNHRWCVLLNAVLHLEILIWFELMACWWPKADCKCFEEICSAIAITSFVRGTSQRNDAKGISTHCHWFRLFETSTGLFSYNFIYI